MELKQFGKELIGIKTTSDERGIIKRAANAAIQGIARAENDTVATTEKATANKKVQAIGAAVVWLNENEPPLYFWEVEGKGIAVEVGAEDYTVMNRPALKLIEESLTNYSDITIDTLASNDFPLNDMYERANRGNVAAGMASQLHAVLAPESQA
jgi:hypothetical protein